MRDIPINVPGGELVRTGIADLARGAETDAALIVAMAAPRLRSLGFEIPPGGGVQPSHRLYALLVQTDPSPHSRYNALVGRVASFARALEHATTG